MLTCKNTALAVPCCSLLLYQVTCLRVHVNSILSAKRKQAHKSALEQWQGSATGRTIVAHTHKASLVDCFWHSSPGDATYDASAGLLGTRQPEANLAQKHLDLLTVRKPIEAVACAAGTDVVAPGTT